MPPEKLDESSNLMNHWNGRTSYRHSSSTSTHKGRSIEKSLRSWRRGQSLTPAAVRAWQADLFGNLIESRT
jgi:hypothetical protein